MTSTIGIFQNDDNSGGDSSVYNQKIKEEEENEKKRRNDYDKESAAKPLERVRMRRYSSHNNQYLVSFLLIDLLPRVVVLIAIKSRIVK